MPGCQSLCHIQDFGYYDRGSTFQKLGLLGDGGIHLTNTEKLTRDIKAGNSLGCSDHATVVFTILRDMSQMKCKAKTPNFRRVDFQLFKKLLDVTPWETALGDKGSEKSWQFFKNIFLRVHELSILMCKQLGKKGR